jgi:hypothetical protein
MRSMCKDLPSLIRGRPDRLYRRFSTEKWRHDSDLAGARFEEIQLAIGQISATSECCRHAEMPSVKHPVFGRGSIRAATASVNRPGAA